MKNLLVCSTSKQGLKKINESINGEQKYFLEGVFAELDTLNRNKRIYPKDEYLKHLAYLRDDIKSGEPLLGELDHPDDRFEVKLKEASHRIVDLWYDADTNTVRGKIELLNTPNGKLAQSMVDQGIPLHISSRAAGTVGNDNKVSIQQIYTYDLVCKPGFAGAVLHRVDESAVAGNKYSEGANNFLQKSMRSEAANAAAQFGFLNEEFSIRELNCDVKLRQDIEEKLKENDNKDNMDNKKVEKTDLEKEEAVATEAKKDIKPKLKSVFEAGEEGEDEPKDTEGAAGSEEGADGAEGAEGEGSSEEGGEDEGVKIKSVEVETTSDSEGDEEGVDIKDVDKEGDEGSEDGSDEEGKEGDEDKKDDDNAAEESKTDECGAAEGKDGGCDGGKCDPKKDALFDCDGLKAKKEKTLDKIDELIDTIKKKKEESKSNESITINKYPKSAMLNESNFQEFMKLDESQKSNVIAYLDDNGKYTPESINESWKNGINYDNQEVWLKFAPANYKQLFESASDAVKSSIRNTAKYLLFENKADINSFWENTGLMERQYSQSLNEKFINTMPRIVESVKPDNELPYSQDFINTVAEMACEYNK